MTDVKLRVWRKGDKAPDRCVPYRHQRDRATLLLGGMTDEQKDAALRTMIENDSRPVLDALIAVLEADGE